MTYRQLIRDMMDAIADLDKEIDCVLLHRDEENCVVFEDRSLFIGRVGLNKICLEKEGN